jgi:hypothetical protein
MAMATQRRQNESGIDSQSPINPSPISLPALHHFRPRFGAVSRQ